MKIYLMLALIAAGLPLEAGAYTEGGGRYTSGPDGYSGFSVFAEWGGDYHYFRPAANAYRSADGERIATYSLGSGLEREKWSAGAEISATPEVGGYGNTGIYGDFVFFPLGDPGEDAAVQDVSVGFFAGYTAHEDQFSASTITATQGGGRRSSFASLAEPFRLGQTNYGLSSAIRAYGMRISGRYTKTVYSEDVDATAREVPLSIGGIGAAGFSDEAVSVRLRLPGLPLAPEAGYARNTYLLDRPASESFSLGVTLGLGRAELTGGLESLNPGGGLPREEYWSLGISVEF